MGRKKRRSDDRGDYDYLLYKVKKLEKELKGDRRRRRHESEDSDYSDSGLRPKYVQDDIPLEDNVPLEDDYLALEEELIDRDSIKSVVIAPEKPAISAALASPPPTLAPTQPPMAPAAPPVLPPTEPSPPPEQETTGGMPPDAGLDDSILEILGDDPSVVKQHGKEIQADLAIRLEHIATTGLDKETRKELCDKYRPPNNCHLIDAPELNPEIRAAVSEAVLKRDKGIELKQKQLGRAIAYIGEALSNLMSKEEKDTTVIRLLMDANRLLCDNQNMDSTTRRNFVLFNLKKEMKDQIQKTKIDKLLFGTDLSETLKTAKSISKSGEDLKIPAPSNKAAVPKGKPAQQQTGMAPKRNNLNWKAPPFNRRPQGSQRTREPAPRNQHASNSRTSYRAPHRRYSNRR